MIRRSEVPESGHCGSRVSGLAASNWRSGQIVGVKWWTDGVCSAAFAGDFGCPIAERR